MFHLKKAGIGRPPRPRDVAADAARELARLARPIGEFDPTRYFRADEQVRFHGVTTAAIRDLARTIDGLYGEEWGLDGAMEFAGALVPSAYLDEKGLGIELLARHRRDFKPKLLRTWKQWLADDHASNWATTDAICGALIGPLVVAYPKLASKVAAWARHKNLWVRRASAVALISSVRKGEQLDLAYGVAAALHADGHDLIEKAVGWMLREAGKADPKRLEKYLREKGRAIPRTTVRYAIERFAEPKRQSLLTATKS